MDDALKIGIIILGLCFASAIVAWDPRILFPEYQSESGVKTGGDPEIAMSVKLNASSIHWGTLSPGGFTERGLLIENSGSDPGVLSVLTGNYTPVEAQEFLNLSWSLASGFLLEPGKNVVVILRLDVSPDVKGITDFRFEIMVLINALPKS